MKKLTLTTAILVAMTASSAFAHHPSEGMNPNFERVDDQLEAVESPHFSMDMDDMGATTAAGDSDMASAMQSQAGWQSNQAQAGGAFDIDMPADAVESSGWLGVFERHPAADQAGNNGTGATARCLRFCCARLTGRSDPRH